MSVQLHGHEGRALCNRDVVLLLELVRGVRKLSTSLVHDWGCSLPWASGCRSARARDGRICVLYALRCALRWCSALRRASGRRAPRRGRSAARSLRRCPICLLALCGDGAGVAWAVIDPLNPFRAWLISRVLRRAWNSSSLIGGSSLPMPRCTCRRAGVATAGGIFALAAEWAPRHLDSLRPVPPLR